MGPTVVLVDDNSGVLTSLEALFETAGYVVHAFTSAEAFLARIDSLPVSCVVTDLRMPTMSGLALVRRLTDLAPRVWPTIVISGHADVSDAVDVMQAGAFDFLLKPVPPKRLLAAVEGAWARRVTAGAEASSETGTRYAALTPREKQVVEHLVAGSSSRVCGEALGISPRTVDVFRGRILRKMGTANIAALSTAIASLAPGLRVAG